jgi:predicted RNA-binding protein Jag
LAEIYNLSEAPGKNADMEEITSQTLSAIEAVRNGQRWVDLPPSSPRVRRMQHDIVRDAELISHSYGKEPNRRVRVFRE